MLKTRAEFQCNDYLFHSLFDERGREREKEVVSCGRYASITKKNTYDYFCTQSHCGYFYVKKYLLSYVRLLFHECMLCAIKRKIVEEAHSTSTNLLDLKLYSSHLDPR